MSADIVHHGYLNIIKEAQKLHGYVIVGLLTDEAIASYKRLPLIPFKNRKLMVESIKSVNEVVPQETLDYIPNLQKLKPNFVIHGDDWYNSEKWNNFEEQFKKVGVRIVYFPYTKGTSSTLINEILIKERDNVI